MEDDEEAEQLNHKKVNAINEEFIDEIKKVHHKSDPHQIRFETSITSCLVDSEQQSCRLRYHDAIRNT